jgi:sulfur carrier protein ThiS
MKVLFINNEGSGFADYLEIQAGTTVEKLFAQQLPYGKPQDYLIRVNRQPVAANQELMDGDRISITANKIQGA